MDDAERAELKLPRIHDIPLDQIDDFPDHPFKVREDEDMEQLVQSVRERGIITPVTVRPKEDGRYEIVSGHRRKKACELAGLGTVKAEIKEMSRDEATILMVDSNLQRTNILPSEKARSYWMKLEAMKRRQGQRTDLTSAPVGQKSLSSREILAEESPDSHSQIQRYIRLMDLMYNATDKVYILAENKSGVYYVTGFTTEKDNATVFTPHTDAHILVKGLEADTYKLTETATDSGYVLLRDDVTVVITTADDDACETCGTKLLTASATVNGEDTTMTGNNAIVPLTVMNNKGFVLPKTGGYGTWAYTVGGVLLLGAAAFVVLKSRKKEAQ